MFPEHSKQTSSTRRLPAVLGGGLLLLLGALLFQHHTRASAVPPQTEVQDGPPVPRIHYGRRLEPAGNTVLHGAGQSYVNSFISYSSTVAPARPVVYMTYVDLRDDIPAYFLRLEQDLSSLRDPALLPQIGLALNHGDPHAHYESETAQGADDAALDQFCAGLKTLNRPVFVRPGYEFNGPWNGYLPTGYIAAFRRISSRIHRCAPQAAIVWDWSADAELDTEAGGNPAPASSRWQPFYPGSGTPNDPDDSVDWWGLNLFTPASIRSVATEQFLQAAARSRHPVMIAESTPKGFDLQTSTTAWNDWFEPYFALIHTHPVLQAFCYINWNWAGYPQWADWGDGRIETAPPALQQRLRDELHRPIYQPPAIEIERRNPRRGPRL